MSEDLRNRLQRRRASKQHAPLRSAPLRSVHMLCSVAYLISFHLISNHIMYLSSVRRILQQRVQTLYFRLPASLLWRVKWCADTKPHAWRTKLCRSYAKACKFMSVCLLCRFLSAISGLFVRVFVALNVLIFNLQRLRPDSLGKSTALPGPLAGFRGWTKGRREDGRGERRGKYRGWRERKKKWTFASHVAKSCILLPYFPFYPVCNIPFRHALPYCSTP